MSKEAMTDTTAAAREKAREIARNVNTMLPKCVDREAREKLILIAILAARDEGIEAAAEIARDNAARADKRLATATKRYAKREIWRPSATKATRTPSAFTWKRAWTWPTESPPPSAPC